MAVINPANLKDDALLSAYKNEVRAKLYAQLKPAAEEALLKAVDEAVKSLEAKIQTYYDNMRMETLVKITAEIKDARAT